MAEIDGMVLTQTRAILSYLAAKYDLNGKDLKETVRYHSVHVLSKLCSFAPAEIQFRCRLSAWARRRRQGEQRGDALAIPTCAVHNSEYSRCPLLLLMVVCIQHSYPLPTPHRIGSHKMT